MAASTRIKATNIKLTIASTEYSCDATMVELSIGDAPGDVRTFCEVQTGQQWTLSLEGITSGDSASLYQLLFTNYGTEVAFKVAPYGNTTATSSQPIYEGTAIFDQLPPLSLSAGDISTFKVDLTVKPGVHTPSATPPIFFGLTKKTSA